MPMLGAILTPHPPVLLPEVGRGRERQIAATGRAMEEAARAVAGWNPDVLIVASPHTILYGDYFHIAPGPGASGSMAAFGAPQVQIEVTYDAPPGRRSSAGPGRRSWKPAPWASGTRPWTMEC